jgi:diaminopimelate decarboxylase
VLENRDSNINENKIMEKIRYERPVIKKLNAGLISKFGTRTEHEVVNHIEGVSVKNLIKQYGSPLFVISESIKNL